MSRFVIHLDLSVQSTNWVSFNNTCIHATILYVYIGAFYYMLGNIHPKFRSRLKMIQLVSLCYTKYIKKYSMNTVLEVIVNDLKKLVIPILASYRYTLHMTVSVIQEQGHQFLINGVGHVFHGTIAVVSADNLGSNALGGFKESASAHRHCRQCLGTQSETRNKVCTVCHSYACM